MTLTNRAYDILSWAVRIFLPAVSALYFGLAQIWGLPAAEQVVGTIALVTVFLGTLIGISNRNYQGDGQIVAEPGETGDAPKLALQFDYTLEELLDKEQVVLKILP